MAVLACLIMEIPFIDSPAPSGQHVNSSVTKPENPIALNHTTKNMGDRTSWQLLVSIYKIVEDN